jgi:putative flavoprotein involved in K+ transport
MSEEVETVIVGGGQAGLAVGYHLAQLGRSFVILDANERPGDSWRRRWDSLRLFTPAYLSDLPGLEFPGPRSRCPTTLRPTQPDLIFRSGTIPGCSRSPRSKTIS